MPIITIFHSFVLITDFENKLTSVFVCEYFLMEGKRLNRNLTFWHMHF